MLERTLQFRGTVLDLPPDEIQNASWSRASGVFFRDLATQRVPGYEGYYKVAGDYPVFCYPVQRRTTALWLLVIKRGADTVVLRWDGGATGFLLHTYVGLDPLTVDWQATDLNGTIILNNGISVPRYWNEAGDTMDELPGWPAVDTFCRSIRAFKFHLFALGLTTSGNVDSPYEFMWSDASAPGPGSIPQRWDAAAETQAGSSQLAAPQGFIVDAIPLRDGLVIFKDFSAHLLQYQGGVFVFQQRDLYISSGMINQRCAAEFNAKLVVASQDDIYVTDGNTMESVCTHQIRRAIFNKINYDRLRYCQMVKRHLYDEIWFCYPTDDNLYCTEAAIYNTRTSRWGFKELPNVSCLNYGLVNEDDPPTEWQDRTWPWAEDPYRWGDRFYDNANDEVVMCEPRPADTEGEVLVNERGWTANGAEIDAEVSREGVVLDDDTETVKTITEIWPHIIGQEGNVIMISAGGTMSEGEPIKWTAPVPYVIGTAQRKVDLFSVGRLSGYRFTSKGGAPWRMYNFRVRFEVGGRF